MSSYFQSIRRLKDAQFYINEITRQFAVWKATQDQVDNPQFKSYQRATTNRLICKEQPAIPIQQAAEYWQPQIPQEPNGGVLTLPSASTITIMLNFDHELEDRSNMNNDALFEFTNNQLMFTDGAESVLSFAVDFNHNSNATFDKLWIPFSTSSQIVYETTGGFSVFTRIKPWVITDLGTPTTPGPAPQTSIMHYYGGPVHNKVRPEVVMIYWGTEWSSGNHLTRRNDMNSAIDAINNSIHWEGFWQYSDIKAPIRSTTHGNIHRNTNCPDDVWTDESDSILNTMMDAGTIPDCANFGQAAGAMGMFDYNHVYCLQVPSGTNIGQNGQAFAGAYTWHIQRGGVWANYCVEPYNDSGFNPWSALQMQEQGWEHEMVHAISGAGFGGCDNSGYGGWLSDSCNSPQHPLASGEECGKRLKELQGTSVGGRAVLCESYWSDMDGRCICPGSGDSFTRRPATNPTPTNSSIRRYIFQKLDDLDNGATAAIGPEGELYFNVKKNGTEYKIKSPAGVIRADNWYELWFSFDYAANAPRMFVNTVFYNQPSTEVLLWNNTHSHFIIANYNVGGATGQFRGAMDDFRLYRNGVTTSDQVQNMSNNGLTVTNIQPSQERGVAIVNRTRLNKEQQNTGMFVAADAESGDVPAAKVSFTGDSFTTTSFTT